MRLKRTVSFTMALILTASMSITNVFATTSSNGETMTEETLDDVIFDTENGEIVPILSEDEFPSEMSAEVQIRRSAEKMDNVLLLGEASASNASKVTVELPEVGDAKSFDIQIDHDLYPEARLYAYIYGGVGDVIINVSDVGAYKLRTNALENSTLYGIKTFFDINGSGGLKDYTVTVSTETGNIGCALILATEQTLAEMCGGQENIAHIQKNEVNKVNVTRLSGSQPLLQGDGEWYRYTADGDTFIHAYASMLSDYTITVYDAETGTVLDKTAKKDLEIQRLSSTVWTGHVSKRFALKPGRDYLIQVQSGSTLATDSNDVYRLSVGLPSTTGSSVEINSTSTYSIPANTYKTFKFNVSGVQSIV